MNPSATPPCPAAFSAPSDWVRRWAHLAPAGLPVLDVACGHGRNMRWLAQAGHRVMGVDRDAEALRSASAWGPVVQADLEREPWPLALGAFGAVVVCRYLWRPLLPTLLAALAPGGVLIYETFARGNETVGRPSNPDFLLQDGELLALCPPPHWRVVAYEHGFVPEPAHFVQRMAAVRLPAHAPDAPPRHLLT